MSTTTLKLSETLKMRIAPLAQSAAQTPHAWMIGALETQIQLAEARQNFIQGALDSAADIDAGGAFYAMENVHQYIVDKAAGKPAQHPQPVATKHRRR